MDAKVPLTVAVDLQGLVDALTDINAPLAAHEELLSFIIALDERVCDLEFTEKLAKHFTSIVKAERAADKKMIAQEKRARAGKK